MISPPSSESTAQAIITEQASNSVPAVAETQGSLTSPISTPDQSNTAVQVTDDMKWKLFQNNV
jgi:hypothetical protein